ncbi:unnamed protein product [Closterium sp. NIES-54]
MFPGEKAGPYINRCKNLRDEFRKSGGNFPDGMFVTIILAGLSPEWRQCKSLLRTQGTLSETALCSTLLSEQKEIDLYNKRGNKKEKIAFYAQAPPDKKRLFCKYCKKTGHIIQDCWKLNGNNNNNQKVAAAHQQGGAFCRAHGIRQAFTLPASPQQNGIAERRIGMVMDVARTSMIHAAAPHFVGDASAFRVWGSRAFVRDLSADKLSPRAVPCVFLGFPPDAPGWQFYHPTSRRVLSSQNVTFDESVPFYRLFPYRAAPLPLPPLFLAPGPPPVDPLPPQGPAPSGVSQVDAVEPVEVAVDSGAARCAGSGGAESGGAETGSLRVLILGALGLGVLSLGVLSLGVRAAGAGGPPAAPGPGGARTGGTGVVGTGGAATAAEFGPAGASGAAGAGAAGGVGAGVGAAGASGAASAGAARGVGAGVGTTGASGAARARAPGGVGAGVGPAGGTAGTTPPYSPYSPYCWGFSRPTRTSRRALRTCPPAVPGTHQMTLRPSTAPLHV